MNKFLINNKIQFISPDSNLYPNIPSTIGSISGKTDFTNPTLVEGGFGSNNTGNSHVINGGRWTSQGINAPGIGPASSPYVAAMTYPSGFAGGSSPDNIANATISSNNWQHLYSCFFIKISSNWYSHPVLNKLLYLWLNNTPLVFMGLVNSIGSGVTSSLSLEFLTQGTGGNQTLTYNTGSFYFLRDTWYRLEVETATNTPGTADGVVRVWVTQYNPNGTIAWGPNKYIDYTNALYIASGSTTYWNQVAWTPVWGGAGSTVPAVQYMFMDQIAFGGAVSASGVASTVSIVPNPATVATSSISQFYVNMRDVDNNPVKTSTITWSAISGTINTNGYYSASATTGTDIITAVVDGITATASITISAPSTASAGISFMQSHTGSRLATNFVECTPADTTQVTKTAADGSTITFFVSGTGSFTGGQNNNGYIMPLNGALTCTSNTTGTLLQINLVPGTYDVHMAFGGSVFGSLRGYYTIKDANGTVLHTYSSSPLINVGQFLDASGVLRTSDSDWLLNNTPISIGVTGSYVTVAIGSFSSGYNSVISAIQFIKTG